MDTKQASVSQTTNSTKNYGKKDAKEIQLEVELISATPTSTTIELKWKERFPGKSSVRPIYGSIVRFGKYTDGTIKLYTSRRIPPNQFSYVITDLEPDSSYKVRVSFLDHKRSLTGYVSKVVRTTAEAETATVPPTTTTDLTTTPAPSEAKLIGHIYKRFRDLKISWDIEGVDLKKVTSVRLIIKRGHRVGTIMLNKEFPVGGHYILEKVPERFVINVQIDVFVEGQGNILRATKIFKNHRRARSVQFESTSAPPSTKEPPLMPLEIVMVVAGMTPTSIALEWKEKFAGRSREKPIHGSLVRFARVVNNILQAFKSERIPPNQFNYTITGLQPEAYYRVQVGFLDADGKIKTYVEKGLKTPPAVKTTLPPPTPAPSEAKLIGHIYKRFRDLKISWDIEGVDLKKVTSVRLIIRRGLGDGRIMLNKEFPVGGHHILERVPIDVFVEGQGNILRATKSFRNHRRARSVRFESTSAPPPTQEPPLMPLEIVMVVTGTTPTSIALEWKEKFAGRSREKPIHGSLVRYARVINNILQAF
ncbi:hypothetical protein PoB_000357800, partial [Plakobranchus ocellatus]